MALAEHCPCMTSLDLTGCSLIEDPGVQVLPLSLTLTLSLSLSLSHSMSESVVAGWWRITVSLCTSARGQTVLGQTVLGLIRLRLGASVKPSPPLSVCPPVPVSLFLSVCAQGRPLICLAGLLGCACLFPQTDARAPPRGSL